MFLVILGYYEVLNTILEIEMQLFKIVFWIYSIRYIVTLQIYIYILN